ncbi:MAG: hypothetical protein V1800_13975 [Candidatus Latescibacterota bacterium]
MTDGPRLTQHDIDRLRLLADRKAEIAQDPVNLERKACWYALDAGSNERPMILAEVMGVRDEKPPLPDSVLQCDDSWARGIEKTLLLEIYQFDVLKDDHVVEPFVKTSWKVAVSGYGVEVVQHSADADGRMGARRWDSPIRDLDADFDRLQLRTYSVDREATHTEKERLEQVFGSILPVRIRGDFWWSVGMTWPAIELIGLENLMVCMFDNPKGLHRLMAFLRDDYLAFARWLEREELLSLNNENDYIGSGSMGYTRSLPARDWKGGDPVRLKDQWVLLESQETVGVGPEQFEEFIFPYQLSLAEKFGRCYYGCCEPVHNRWHILKRLPHLARVSISPWADEEFMAEALGRNIVYSRKPNPTLVSTQSFNEEAIRADLRKTLSAARNCPLEIIMKDVHTLNNDPTRLPRWVEIAREECERPR